MSEKTLQWIGSGVLHVPGKNKKILKYGDVITSDVQKQLGKKRIDQFKEKGKIGQVPLPSQRGSADELNNCKETLVKIKSAHDGLLAINENLNGQIVELTTVNEEVVVEKAELAKKVVDLKTQIEDLLK